MPVDGSNPMHGSFFISDSFGRFKYRKYCLDNCSNRFGYDDSLDAFGVHGMCGVWGALATGLFANPAINEAGRGLFYGNPKQLWIQIISILATAIFTAVGTLVVVYVTRWITGGLRVEEENEIIGLDNSIHGERAFEITLS
jgi:Amt family ammonium transporter